MEAYLLIDDYGPDAGSQIWGAFATCELAQTELTRIENPDNEWGCNMNEGNTIEIRPITVQES